MNDSLSPVAFISLVFVILLVISVNLLLLKALRKKDSISEFDLMRRAAGRLKQPWKPEDDQLQALSILVERFKSGDHPESHGDKESSGTIDVRQG